MPPGEDGENEILLWRGGKQRQFSTGEEKEQRLAWGGNR